MAFPYMPYPYQVPMMQNYAIQQPQQSQSGLIWVQGESGAKSHPVSAGQSVLLMDSESNRFFIKSADASGMPLPLRVFDYTERDCSQNAPRKLTESSSELSSYITREEFEERMAHFRAIYEKGEENAE